MKEGSQPPVGGRYAKYVLVVLVIVYVFNFIDRQILSILAEDLKADLGITDAQIGFLYGTAFAVFYAIFGIPLGRLADVWVRKSLISIGLFFWSAMTALSGTARNFPMLAVFRFGVGIGEASASPAAFSMLGDWFPPRLRATALSIYSSGIYIGAGIGIFLGGVIVDGWNGAYPDTSAAPFGLKGWQAAFMAVGLPGLIMAVWVWTLREPVRGISEGIVTPPHPHPFRETWNELMAVLPPFTLLSIWLRGGGVRGLLVNLAAAVLVILGAWGLVVLTGALAQWTALGIGVYATFSWAQGLALRDPPAFTLVFRTRALLLAAVGFATISFVTYGIGFWGAPFFIRVHGESASNVGIYLGLSAALGGWIGVTSGGVISDWLRKYTPNARLWVGLAVPTLSIPCALVVLTTDTIWVAYVFNFLFSLVSPMWVGPAATTINDLVLPRMRALASAFYILLNTFIGLALGPYMIGQVSDTLATGGMDSGEALRTAMLLALGAFVVVYTCLGLALRDLGPAERSRLQRARAAGEVLEEPA